VDDFVRSLSLPRLPPFVSGSPTGACVFLCEYLQPTPHLERSTHRRLLSLLAVSPRFERCDGLFIATSAVLPRSRSSLFGLYEPRNPALQQRLAAIATPFLRTAPLLNILVNFVTPNARLSSHQIQRSYKSDPAPAASGCELSRTAL